MYRAVCRPSEEGANCLMMVADSRKLADLLKREGLSEGDMAGSDFLQIRSS